MRESLIELFKKADEKAGEYIRENDHMDFIPTKDELAGVYADYLLANGVIVPPVAVGQICYQVYMGEILEVRVVSISYEPLPAFSYTIRFNSLGVLCLLQDGTRNEAYSWDIYTTREEAEKALKGDEGK